MADLVPQMDDIMWLIAKVEWSKPVFRFEPPRDNSSIVDNLEVRMGLLVLVQVAVGTVP